MKTYNTEPKSTADVVFSTDTSKKIVSSILNGKLPFPFGGKTAICLFGTYGTGKTAYADIFCNEYESIRSGVACSANVTFISCDSSNNITQLIKNCENIRSYVSLNSTGYHYFIFDEVDNLTQEAQRKLKSFLNHSDIITVMTTNYVHKLDNGLRNRCHSINFNAASDTQYLNRLKAILRVNRLPIPSDELLLSKITGAGGSWRDILSQAFFLSESMTPNEKCKRTPNMRLV
jgi:replication-associated recombination protein RarA